MRRRRRARRRQWPWKNPISRVGQEMDVELQSQGGGKINRNPSNTGLSGPVLISGQGKAPAGSDMSGDGFEKYRAGRLVTVGGVLPFGAGPECGRMTPRTGDLHDGDPVVERRRNRSATAPRRLTATEKEAVLKRHKIKHNAGFVVMVLASVPVWLVSAAGDPRDPAFRFQLAASPGPPAVR